MTIDDHKGDTMDRKNFLKMSADGTCGACAVVHERWAAGAAEQQSWFDKPVRWAQLVLVENDPGLFDPDFSPIAGPAMAAVTANIAWKTSGPSAVWNFPGRSPTAGQRPSPGLQSRGSNANAHGTLVSGS